VSGRAALGSAGPMVSKVCLGTSPLGGMADIYGYDVDEARAVSTVRRFLASSMNFIDTSNEYGDGNSERRIGIALREAGPRRQDLVIASKIDPAKGSGTLDGARVRESLRETLERLEVDAVDVLYLHDPERFEFDSLSRPGGAVDVLCQLREEGAVEQIGVAGGSIPEMHRYLDLGVFDVLLNHNQFTLLDQSADPLIEHAIAAGVAFVNAAPYASGVLAKPMEERPRYKYREAEAPLLERVMRLQSVCLQFDVPLPAVALQFSTRDRRITSTVVGVSAPERVDDLVRNAAMTIPDDLWPAIAGI
jgi:D-threo-aldose 1-dehydrogenase